MINNEVHRKLTKLIPMLSSDNDGEVLATVSAIKRTLSSAKLSMHDIVSSSKMDNTQAYNSKLDLYEHKCEEVLKFRLGNNEREFIMSVIEKKIIKRISTY